MKEIRIILMMLTGLLMTACTTGEDGNYSDSYLNNPTEKQENGDPSPSDSELVDTIVYEGIWSIDGTPLEQQYTVACIYNISRGQQTVTFPTFPYQAIAEHAVPDMKVVGIIQPAQPFELEITLLGYSEMAAYYSSYSSGKDYSWSSFTYTVITEDEGHIGIKLGLNYEESAYSLSRTSANCILIVNQLELYYDDDRHRTLELNPAMKLTFVSTKRL